MVQLGRRRRWRLPHRDRHAVGPHDDDPGRDAGLGARGCQLRQTSTREFIVNQSVWKEGETPYCDVILPACIVFEKWDIGGWYNVGTGYVHNMYSINNHRVIWPQHKCIEPLGESKSDYDIVLAVAAKLDLGAMYSEGGTSELDWRSACSTPRISPSTPPDGSSSRRVTLSSPRIRSLRVKPLRTAANR